MKKLIILSTVILILVTILGAGKVFLNKAEEAEQDNLNLEKTNTETNEKVIVAFGDSLTAGFGVKEDESYPALLQKKLDANGYSYKVINEGISGDTTKGGLGRVEKVLSHDPDIVILSLGANDALAQLPTETIKNNLTQIIKKLKDDDTQVVLAGIKPLIDINERYTNQINSIYPSLSSENNIPLVPNVLEGVLGHPERTLPDRAHPNALGYKVIVEENIWPQLIKVLEK